MDEHIFDERLAASATHWRDWLQKHGLVAIADTFLEAIEPLSALGAQALYVAQPALSIFMRREAIQDWASLLETPGGLTWLRQQLIEHAENDDGR